MLGRRHPSTPTGFLRWWQDESTALRRNREIADLGAELDDLGRRLAERWGCDPLVIDAAWLHADRDAKAPPGRCRNRTVWRTFRKPVAGSSKPRGRWAEKRSS